MLNNDVTPKTRLELLRLAHTLRVTDADVMTRAELRAAIERARGPESRPPQPLPASWLGKARRLLASVVERGLHLPEAATLIRGGLPVRPFTGGPPPVATVTLARIYAAQGHLVRALGILDEVLVSDPDHDLARDLRGELQKALDERREQERRQAADAATAAAAESGPGALAEVEPKDAPPSEAQLAASELLDAVPDADRASSDDITLAGTPVAAATLAAEQPLVSQPVAGPSEAEAPGAVEAQAEVEVEVEVEAETRRASGAPEPLVASDPEPITVPEPEAATAQPEVATAQPEATTASSVVTPEPPPAVTPPRSAGLVLIETSAPDAYLYWELATPALGSGTSNGASNGHGSEPHWVSVVAHAPRGAGSERREYRFPVQRSAGAVRIAGLPRFAVVRAKLTRGEAREAPPLVVAGSVRVSSGADDCDGNVLKQAQAGFLPHPAADPTALALRAAAHLASAAPLYY